MSTDAAVVSTATVDLKLEGAMVCFFNDKKRNMKSGLSYLEGFIVLMTYLGVSIRGKKLGKKIS